MITRPAHLTARQIRGRMFGTPAALVTVTTTVNDFGEASDSEASVDITCATAPPTMQDARVRELQESGVALEAMRQFWTVETPRPVADDSQGDIIVYPRNGERWRVRAVGDWGGFSDSIAVRIEGQ